MAKTKQKNTQLPEGVRENYELLGEFPPSFEVVGLEFGKITIANLSNEVCERILEKQKDLKYPILKKIQKQV